MNPAPMDHEGIIRLSNLQVEVREKVEFWRTERDRAAGKDRLATECERNADGGGTDWRVRSLTKLSRSNTPTSLSAKPVSSPAQVSLRPSGRAAERRCWRVLWGCFVLHVLIVWWLVR